MLSFSRRFFIASGLSLGLGACDFKPIYGRGTTASGLRNQIEVKIHHGRNAYELRDRLEQRLGTPKPGARYMLDYKLDIASDELAVSATGAITRYNLTGVVKYSLRDSTTDQIVFSDTQKAFTAYGATAKTYPTRVAERDANIRLARALGEQMALRIATTSKDWVR